MARGFAFTVLMLGFGSCGFSWGQSDNDEWRNWRGPSRNGMAAEQQPPLSWSDSENILWSIPVQGRGHASPTVVGNQVILASSDVESETQFVVSYDLENGAEQWRTVCNKGNFNPQIYPTNTHASSTVCSDGERLFAVFNNNRAAQLVALDLAGNILWEKKAADFIPQRYQFGFGASPILHNGNVIVTSECEQRGAIVAFRVTDGEEIWRIDRPRATSYSTPSIAEVAGREQMVISGGNRVESYDPATGDLLWSVDAQWVVTCGTAVWDDQRFYVSGGFPRGQTLAVEADGSGKIAWENRVKFYEQSLLLYDGYLYGLADTGVAYCFRASDGKEMWKERLEQGVSASPVLANGNIYISVESGTTFVFRATPDGYEEVARNKLGDVAYATPTFVRNRILLRVGHRENNVVSETLYCVGQ